MTFLVPYMEATTLYEALDVDKNLKKDRLNHTGSERDVRQCHPFWELGTVIADGYALELARYDLTTYVCPSTDAPRANSDIVGIHTVPTALKIRRLTHSSKRLGTTNYLGVMGALGPVDAPLKGGFGPSWKQWNGVFSSRSKTRFSDITDGTSNVLLFGEVSGPENFAWIANGAMPTAWGFGKATHYRFSSQHHDGLQFAMADGNVRFVSTAMNQDIYRFFLAGMRDGNTVENYSDSDR